MVVLAGVLLASGALALSWYFVLRDTSEPASLREAVRRFREENRAATGPLPVATPEPGVYVYATSGSESVDVLFGASHEYPEQTTITVEQGGCGLLLRWDALSTRSTTWEVCPSSAGWAIRKYSEVHRFFGQTERTTYVCDAGSLWGPVPQTPGSTFERHCSTGKTRENSVGRVVRIETLAVGDEQIETAHLTLAVTLAGRTDGTGTFDLWLATDNGLVVRLSLENDNASSSAIGDVRYREVARLELVSDEPRT
jgi:hypothetical protein